MEFNKNNVHGNHHITVSNDEYDNIHITITRVPINGGVPRTVLGVKPINISFIDAIHYINKICQLDDELYLLLVNNL